MCLSALLDTGVPLEILEKAVDQLNVPVALERINTIKNGLRATQIKVRELTPQPPSRSMRELLEILERSSLPESILLKSKNVLLLLAQAEAEVHGIEPDSVHFHEIGGLDTLVDIAGTVAMISYLNIDQIRVSPLPLARGIANTAHGLLPLPAPATLNLLKNVPTYGVPLEVELVTPTGAALAVSLATDFGPPPQAAWEKIGYGAGSMDLPCVNVLRAWLGEKIYSANISKTAPLVFDHDTVIILETQIDDCNPEFIPYLLSQLEESGAIDVTITPVLMKKGRPGNIITVITPSDHLFTLASILFRESSALGMRWYPASRIKLFRKTFEVSTPYGDVSVKAGFARRPDGTPEYYNLAPEYESCARQAQKTGASIKDVYQAAIRATSFILDKDD